MLAKNTSGLTMCKLRIFLKFAFGWLPAVQCLSFSWPPAGCKFHSVSRQLDANFIQSATSRMQISFSQPPAGCKLHPTSGHAIQNTQIYQ